MDEIKLQQHIRDWLAKYHDQSAHQDILERACCIGSKSKPWTVAIQRYVYEVCMREPRKPEIKRVCKALLEKQKGTE